MSCYFIVELAEIQHHGGYHKEIQYGGGGEAAEGLDEEDKGWFALQRRGGRPRSSIGAGRMRSKQLRNCLSIRNF